MRQSEMYSVLPTKGKYRNMDIHVIQFTAVRNCRMERCPIYDLCTYVKNPNNKCKIEMTYLDAVFKSLCNIVRNKMTQQIMNKFTLHLLPLHQQLIKFKIKAYSVDDVCYETVQGQIKIHPIFKEIRETIKQIEATQKSMGFDLEYTRALGLVGKRLSAKEDPDKYGDTDYWDEWRTELDEDIFPEGTKKGIRRSSSESEEQEDSN